MFGGESDMKQRLLQEIIKLFEKMPDQEDMEKPEENTEALQAPAQEQELA